MKLWMHIITILIIQEIITTNAVLLQAYQANYNFLLISLVFVIATTITISLGFWLGKFIQHRFSYSKIVRYSEKKVKDFENIVGKKGSRVTLIMLGVFNFNYINAFLASWLTLSYWEVLFYILIGDFIWYALDVAMIFGVNAYIDAKYTLYFVMGISILMIGAFSFIQRKMMHLKRTA